MTSTAAPELDHGIGVAEPRVVPLARAALALHLTREQALRRLMSGRLTGRCVDGKWVVDASALTAALEKLSG
jgi:hypothetical protein